VSITHLRAALREWRLRNGLTYDQLADDIRRVNGNNLVSAPTVRRFLAEDHDPSERIAYAINAYAVAQRVVPGRGQKVKA
jgi:transcriptional regulator with XRE-family HTH domain